LFQNEEHIPLPLPVFIKHNLRLNIVSLILHHPGELALPLEVNSFVRRKIGAGKSNAQSKQITPSLRMKWVPLKIRGNDFRYDKNLAEFAKESVKQCAQYAEDNHGSIECWSYADYQVYMLSYYKVLKGGSSVKKESHVSSCRNLCCTGLDTSTGRRATKHKPWESVAADSHMRLQRGKRAYSLLVESRRDLNKAPKAK